MESTVWSVMAVLHVIRMQETHDTAFIIKGDTIKYAERKTKVCYYYLRQGAYIGTLRVYPQAAKLSWCDGVSRLSQDVCDGILPD